MWPFTRGRRRLERSLGRILLADMEARASLENPQVPLSDPSAWAALFAWFFVMVFGLSREGAEGRVILGSTVSGAILGALLAAVVGTLDALLNSVGFQRVLRPLVAMGVAFGPDSPVALTAP